MRDLLAKELHFVAGGFKALPPVTLDRIIVRPPRPVSQALPYHPPSTGREVHNGGGARAPVSAPGSGLSTQVIAGISRIKDQLGVDLTTYAQMSPTLAHEISTATATWNFRFAYDAAGSHLNWDDQVKGTIYINSAYQNNISLFVRGMAHELGHVDHAVRLEPSQVTSQHYVNENLVGEGFATLSNLRIRHEILAAGGIDIGLSGNEANHALYEAEYSRFSNRQVGMPQAAAAIGVIYGHNELAGPGMSYHDSYLKYYREHGGTK